MSGFGQFSQEAYDQLREAYADSLTQAENVENEGVKIGGETLGLETAPFKTDWLDKTGVWQYPSGKGDYQDARQSPEDLMAALRDENGEIKSSFSDVEDEEEEDIDLESMTDDEIDAFVDQLLTEMEDEEDQGEEEEEEYEDEDIDLSDLSDEELLELAKEVLVDEGEDEEEETSDQEDEEDLISVSDKIAALKEELAALSANMTLEEDEEESTEETDSEEDPIEEEEVNSNDESA